MANFLRNLGNDVYNIISMYAPNFAEWLKDKTGGTTDPIKIDKILGTGAAEAIAKAGRVTDKIQAKIDSISAKFGGSNTLANKRAAKKRELIKLRDEAGELADKANMAKQYGDQYRDSYNFLSDAQKNNETGKQLMQAAKEQNKQAEDSAKKIIAMEARI